ncbi:MAG: hypothetical protein KAI79_17955 [Bacteroidales bacterium]|nr:hypothetical protein [Bacteroidales bacterium]
MQWQYKTNSKITRVGRNDSTYLDPEGIVVDNINLIPQQIDMAMSVCPQDEPNMDALKDALIGEIADKLLIDILVLKDPFNNTTSYRASSVVYFKPDEIQLFAALNREKSIVDGLNKELHNARELVNHPWELFKLSFVVKYNQLKSKFTKSYYRNVI